MTDLLESLRLPKGDPRRTFRGTQQARNGEEAQIWVAPERHGAFGTAEFRDVPVLRGVWRKDSRPSDLHLRDYAQLRVARV